MRRHFSSFENSDKQATLISLAYCLCDAELNRHFACSSKLCKISKPFLPLQHLRVGQLHNSQTVSRHLPIEFSKSQQAFGNCEMMVCSKCATNSTEPLHNGQNIARHRAMGADFWELCTPCAPTTCSASVVATS